MKNYFLLSVVVFFIITQFASCSYDRKLIFPDYEICYKCQGTGHSKILGMYTPFDCENCNGKGSVPLPEFTIEYVEEYLTRVPCSYCGGNGGSYTPGVFYPIYVDCVFCSDGTEGRWETQNRIATFRGYEYLVGNVMYNVIEGCFLGKACSNCGCEEFRSVNNASRCDNCNHLAKDHSNTNNNGNSQISFGASSQLRRTYHCNAC